MRRAKQRRWPQWTYIETWEFSRALGKLAEASASCAKSIPPLQDALREFCEVLLARAPKALANAKAGAAAAISLARIGSRR
jgi:hypothetical protein